MMGTSTLPVVRPFLIRSFFLFPVPPHVEVDFRSRPSWLWPSVTDFRDWGAHSARLCCPADVSDDEYGV